MLKNNIFHGESEYWLDDWTVSVSDSGEISCNATYISRYPVCPVGFETLITDENGVDLIGEDDQPLSTETPAEAPNMPNTGFLSLRLSNYTISDYNGGFYAVSCVFKSTLQDEEEAEKEMESDDDQQDPEEEEQDQDNENDKKEESNNSWTITGCLEVRPLAEHSRFQNFNGKGLTCAFSMLTDGKIDPAEFFKNQRIVPLNPNDFKFNPALYDDVFDIVERSSDEFLNRLIRGNDVFYNPKYSVTINSIGDKAKTTAFGLDKLMKETGLSFEMTNTETVTENGTSTTTTNLESINPNDIKDR